jgi:hypothetical protein
MLVSSGLPDQVDRGLVTGNNRYPQFTSQRFDRFDGAPVSAGEENAMERCPRCETPQN